MALVSRTVARNILRTSQVAVARRSIMTTSQRTQKALEELEKNPYFEKYANKIATLQQTSPEEFLARIEQQQKGQEKKKEQTDRNYLNLLKPKESLKEKDAVEVKSLDKIMKLELIQDKNEEEIKEIWLKYHLQKDVIAAIMTKADFELIDEQSKKTPIFIFPLPRSQGYEFIMSQFQQNTVHFTPLICYQVHKENAPECLTITHYTELLESKGIVLMRGEYDKNVIDAKEAQCLANQLQLYYNQKDAEKTKLLRQFTERPDGFKHIDTIKQIESLSLG